MTSWHRAFPHDVKVAIFLFQNMGYLASLYIVFHVAVPFLLIPPRLLPKLVCKLAEEIGLQLASKRFPSSVLRSTAKKATPNTPDFTRIET